MTDVFKTKNFVSEITQIMHKYGIDNPDFVMEAHTLPPMKQLETLSEMEAELDKFAPRFGNDPFVFTNKTIFEKANLLYDHAASIKMQIESVTKKSEPDIIERLDDILASKQVYKEMSTGDPIRDACLDFESGYYIFAAEPNKGKTNFLINYTVKFLMEKSRQIIFFSLDDSAESICYRIMACMSSFIGEPYLPCYRMKFLQHEPKLEAIRQGLYKAIASEIKKDNLNIFDIKDCREFDSMKRIIRQKSKDMSKTVVMIDGVLLSDVPSSFRTEIERCEWRANELKRMSVELNIPVITTNEVIKNKENKNPAMADIKGTGRFMFNANMIVMLYPDQKDKDKIYAKIDKNKVTDIKRQYVYHQNGAQSRLTHVEY